MNPPKKMRLKSSDGGDKPKWECPICLVVPPKEIYQCYNGHSICSLCTSKLKECPSCEIGFAVHKIRNHDLEQILDLLKFKCFWEGCNKELSRGDIPEHEEKCPHNPNGIKLCQFIYQSKCNFQFTVESLEYAHKVEQFIEHMNTHLYPEKKVTLGRRHQLVLSLDTIKTRNVISATKFLQGNVIMTLVSVNCDNRKHLFLKFLRIYVDSTGQEVLSIIFVQLTPDFGLNGSPFKVKLSTTTKPDADDILKWGPDSAATLTWGIKPMKIKEFIEYCNRPTAEQKSFPCPIPMSYLESHYTDKNRFFRYEYCITKV